MDVVVGDICKVYEDEIIPADLILLSSQHGAKAFIEMSNTTGEKCLKTKVARQEISNKFIEESKFALLSGEFKLEKSNRLKRIY
jgi:P-type E1-E2 ATPase